MSHAIDRTTSAEDKTTLRRLGLAVMAMCIGAIGLVVLAIGVGNLP